MIREMNRNKHLYMNVENSDSVAEYFRTSGKFTCSITQNRYYSCYMITVISS